MSRKVNEMKPRRIKKTKGKYHECKQALGAIAKALKGLSLDLLQIAIVLVSIVIALLGIVVILLLQKLE